MIHRSRILASALTLFLASLVHAADPQIGNLPVALPGGLAVVSGKDADKHAIALASQGTWLVRILADSDAQALTLRTATQSLHPLITVTTSADKLPFAPSSINLVVLGPGSNLAAAEVKRVLAPNGALFTSKDSTYTRETVPADARFAPWTHWLADAHGSGVSADTAVAPSNSLRWWSQGVIGAQIRSTNGVVAVLEDAQGGENRGRELDRSGLQALDAFSGVPLWYRPLALPKDAYDRNIAVAHPLGFIHLQNGDDQFVVLSDLHTGKIRVTYDQGLKMPAKDVKSQSMLVAWQDTLLQSYANQLVALHIPTGKLLWKIQIPAGGISKLIVSNDGKTLFFQETSEPQRSYGRWGSYATLALTAVNLADGKQLWRNAEWADMETIRLGKKTTGTPWLSELIQLNDTLFAWDHASNIGADHHGDLYALDPATGKIKWHYSDANGKIPGQKEYEKHGPMTNNLVVWNNGLYSKDALYSSTGPTRDTKALNFLGGNQRCVRLSGSANFLVYGFTSFIAKDGTSYQTGLLRGNCAMPNYATYGAVISVTDETCSCHNGLRGQAALIPELPLTLLPDTARLSTPTSESAAPPAKLPDSPLVLDWVPFPSLRLFPNHLAPQSLAVGNLTLSVDTQRHTVTARRGPDENSPVVWTHLADGRIFTTPTVSTDALFISTTAGTVTRLDLATGKTQWRFLAAPMLSELVVNGQLESRWPVYNSLLKDNTLFLAAGRHAETDGGIFIWALDAKTGAILRQCRIFLPISVVRPGPKPEWTAARAAREVASNGVLLGGVALDDQNRLCLINRKWEKSGSRPCANGYWKPAQIPFDQAPQPDFTKPVHTLLPVDLEAWNNKLLDPITAFALHEIPSLRKKIKWTSPFPTN